MNKTKTIYTLCNIHTQLQIDVNKKIFDEIHKINDEYKPKTKRRLRLFGLTL